MAITAGDMTVTSTSFKVFDGVNPIYEGHTVVKNKVNYNGTIIAGLNGNSIITLTTQVNRFRYELLNSSGISYWTSTDRVITYVGNNAPTISITSRNLGKITSWSDINYTVSDVDGNTITVIEKLDNATTLRSGTYSSGTSLSIGMTASIFDSLSYGNHSIVISVKDSNNASAPTVTISFTKSMSSLDSNSSLRDVMDRFEAINSNLKSSYSMLADTLENKGISVNENSSILELVECVGELPSMELYNDVEKLNGDVSNLKLENQSLVQSQKVQDRTIVENDMRIMDLEWALEDLISSINPTSKINLSEVFSIEKSVVYFNQLKQMIEMENYDSKEDMERILNKYASGSRPRITQEEYDILFDLLYPPVYDLK